MMELIYNGPSLSLSLSSVMDSLSILVPSLRSWILLHSGLAGLSPVSVSGVVSGGDAAVSKSVASAIGDDVSEYRLGWFVLQDMMERKLYLGFVDRLTYAEKLFVKVLEGKFDTLLVEMNFNLNTEWRKCGCVVT